jgi:hypothetical protein
MTRALKKIWERMNETMAERPMRNRETNHETKCQSQMSQRLSGLFEAHQVLVISENDAGKRRA